MENKVNVLLVEDNAELNDNNARALKMRGYTVYPALTLSAARKYLTEAEPDIILLDVMLPDGDGVDFCAEIRGATGAHILFLSAKSGQDDVVRGLAIGGDDYITKPFHPKELLARVDAAVRRRTLTAASQLTQKGPLKLNITTSRVFLDGKDISLTYMEYSLIKLFFQWENRYLAAAYIYEQVWNQPMQGDGNALKSMISKLRTKLAGSGYTITSKRGEGYCFELE